MHSTTFRAYLGHWCGSYVKALADIDLFRMSAVLTEEQQRLYVAAFQTFRGHFFETVLLPTVRLAKQSSVPFNYRQRILQGVADTMRDELGLDTEASLSHDELYQQFANAVGEDGDAALWDYESQPMAIRLYNRTLHRYLTSCIGGGWSDVIRGLTVYLFLERIDEFDYGTQLEFASRFSSIRRLEPSERARALEFYSVHAALMDQHFESMPDILDEVWEEHEREIREASKFLIGTHLRMYLGLSEHILASTGRARSNAAVCL